jgi:hypothetical protein
LIDTESLTLKDEQKAAKLFYGANRDEFKLLRKQQRK